MELRPEEISRIIRSQIKHYETKINQSETGTVILIGDGIAKAAGLTGCMVNELLEFPGGVYGMAQNLEESSVSIVMLGSDDGILPAETKDGIKVMSINLLLPDEESPVIWRGPILANMVKQFWTDIVWGEIDYLFVDMPPGTGDVPLTVFQSIPVDGIITVTSPQDLVSLIVKKALNMAKSMDIPVIGLVENYSYVICPDCGKEFKIFGESGLDKLAEELDLPILGRMPIDPKLAELASGEFAKANNEYLAAAESLLIALEG